MEGAATVDYSRAEVAKGKDALIEWRTHNGSACIQTLEAPAVPPDQRLGSARIGGARENDPGADLGAVHKTRMYPLCTPRGAGVGHWRGGWCFLDANVMSRTFY